MAEVPKPRRPRAPEIQRYIPPGLRGPGERPKKQEPIVGFAEDCKKPQMREAIPDFSKTNRKDPERRSGIASAKSRKKSANLLPKQTSRAADHGDTTKSLEVSESENVGELLVVELGQRLPGGGDNSKLAEMIAKGEKDCAIISLEGRAALTFAALLRRASPYFSCTLQKGWNEERRLVIQTKIPKYSLEPVVEFLNSGRIRLTEANVGGIFVVAEYFQIECLATASRDFILRRIDELFKTAIALGFKHPKMAPVAEQAVEYLCENIARKEDTFLELDDEIIVSILSRDELNVQSEDQVCDIVLRWLQQDHDSPTVCRVIECVRLPHLTGKSFEKLSRALEGQEGLPYFDLIRSKKFVDLPEDQLARRLHYNRHIHAVWQESKTQLCPKYLDKDLDAEFRVECVECRNGKVVSTELLQSFADFRRDRESNYEFVPIMNRLHMITHSYPHKFLLVFLQQPDGRWMNRIKYKRPQPMQDFAASVTGAELRISIFDGFHKPLKTLLFEPLNSPDARDVDYAPPVKMYFSPPKMIFRKDMVIYMLDSKIEICDRFTNETFTIHLAPRRTEKTTEQDRTEPENNRKMTAFTDILVYEDTLYAYEKPPAILTCEPVYDRLYVINLKTKETESVTDVVFPRLRARNLGGAVVGGGQTFPKMSIAGCRLVIRKYFEFHDCTLFAEFDPEKKCFDKVAEIPSSDDATYYKKLITLLPVHLNSCEHGSILQEYCHSLRDPGQAAELDQLLFYL